VDGNDDFREFVRARLDRLSRAAYLLSGGHAEAEDLLQTALIKVARRWDRVAAAGDPEAYVRKVLYHEHVGMWRRRRWLEQPVADVPDSRPAPDTTDLTVRRIVLRQALSRLTGRQRAVILLRYFEDLSEVDTARVLGCSVGTVKSQTSHALKRLRQLAPELTDLLTEGTGVES
jgi:RNA polymerase sigma-70 factor (sigma-E family)